LTIQKL